jgi:hypothetical protein
MTPLALAILVTALAGPSIAHRLLVPALGLVVGARAWWPPAPASTAVPDRPSPAGGTGSTTPKIAATRAKLSLSRREAAVSPKL